MYINFEDGGRTQLVEILQARTRGIPEPHCTIFMTKQRGLYVVECTLLFEVPSEQNSETNVFIFILHVPYVVTPH